MDLIELAQDLYDYLVQHNVQFTDDGYPIFTDNMLLREIPEEVLPYDFKFAAKNKKKTILVTYANDEHVYKRLLSLKQDIDVYRQYMGVAGFDLSPRISWDLNLQKFNILLNMMADVYLALNGIKIMPNFRTGSLKTMDILQCYPKNCWFMVGSLGCAKGHVQINEMYLRTKIILTNPDMLIYYGILKSEYKQILEETGINYKVFEDFQSKSRRKGRGA